MTVILGVRRQNQQIFHKLGLSLSYIASFRPIRDHRSKKQKREKNLHFLKNIGLNECLCLMKLNIEKSEKFLSIFFINYLEV